MVCSFENVSRSKINCCATIGEEMVFFGHDDSTISAFSVDFRTKEIKIGTLFFILFSKVIYN